MCKAKNIFSHPFHSPSPCLTLHLSHRVFRALRAGERGTGGARRRGAFDAAHDRSGARPVTEMGQPIHSNPILNNFQLLNVCLNKFLVECQLCVFHVFKSVSLIHTCLVRLTIIFHRCARSIRCKTRPDSRAPRGRRCS